MPKFKMEMQVDTRHKRVGDPCQKCGVVAMLHNEPRDRTDRVEGSRPGRIRHREDSRINRKRDPDKRNWLNATYIGIDGEGQGKDDHRYTFMGACAENGESWKLACKPGYKLRTVECLEFMLGLANRRHKIFSYSFNYDLTKILTDVDNESLYKLFRPEERQRKAEWAHLGPFPVKWNGYELNLQGTKFTIAKDTGKRNSKGKKIKDKVVIWDLIKFFQGKFVNAIKDWKVGDKELWNRMVWMKDQRGDFEKRVQEGSITLKNIEDYCIEECLCMAKLARKLVMAHLDAGLILKAFYGAGSSSAAMLTNMGIQDQIVPMIPQMKHAIASAFFGGRFENSVIGTVREEIYNMDISSAYPYKTTFLPCLIHGTWVHTTNRADLDGAITSLVSYGLGANDVISDWGPFPFRERNGNITYPIESGGGWVYQDEYLEGEKIFPHVYFKEAWVYKTDCDCRPFAKIPEFYLLRLNLGKEGPGIVIKLAVNGCYGKLAQSVGNAMFNNWIWAGIITSGTRAQILEVMGMHRDRSNLLMIATDGIKTRENIVCPEPIKLGTGVPMPCGCKPGKECPVDVWPPHINRTVAKPLGGWEKTVERNGVFLARPGIYFPINPTEEELKHVKARGVGKGTVLDNWKLIVDTWEKTGTTKSVVVANVNRFCGAKTSISKSRFGYRRAIHQDGIKPCYGQWIKRKIAMSFDPLPKRQRINPDGFTLELKRYPLDLRSAPYNKALHGKCEEALEMKMAYEEQLEQPNADFTDWEG